jgi:signal transduction histidine kinase
MSNAVYVLEAKLTDAPPKVKEYLDILRAQVRLSEKIVSDLLDTVRNKPPQRTRVSVGDLVTEQRNRIFMPSSIRIEQDIAPTVPPVYVDRVQIGQVLHNVFMNAVHAMEASGGGTLTLRAQPQNGVVRLEIRDSGPGIPLENQARVFEPLFTTKARGIGLGLSLSRALARANEGDLTVRSEPGAGATFMLEMPAAKAE